MKNWQSGIHLKSKSELKSGETKSARRKGAKSSAYRREQNVQFATLFAAGFNRDQITELMELGPNEYDKLFGEMYTEADKDIKGQSTHKAYTEYVLRQKHLIRNLEQLKGKLSGEDGEEFNSKTAQTYLGAIKTQSDIAHKILMTGVELGILTKTQSKGPGLIDGLDPRDMDEAQLGQVLEKHLTEAHQIKQKTSRKKSARGAKVFKLNPNPKKASG